MGVFRKVVAKNQTQGDTCEPYAAIQYDGSYRTAAQILSFVGLKRLSFKDDECSRLQEQAASDDSALNELLDRMMDNNSNLSLPEIIGSKEDRIYSSRPRMLRVDSWIMALVDSRGIVDFTIISNDEFLSHFRFA